MKSARDACHVPLKNSIVIFDEAHNVPDALNSMHSAIITTEDLKAGLELVTCYFERYKARFSGTTLMFVKQIMMMLERISDKTRLEKYGQSSFINLNDFLTDMDLVHVNLFRVLSFVRDSRLSNKLKGFEKKMAAQSEKQSHPIRKFEQLLCCLVDADEDGRILITNNQTGIVTIKYLLLNPANKFSEILSEAKAVIFAGGTMSPIDDFLLQIAPVYPRENLNIYSCGHVIFSNRLLPIICRNGPTGKEFEFSYNNRGDTALV